MIESIHFGGVTYTPEAFEAFAAAHPEAFLPPVPPVPTLEEAKSARLEDLARSRWQAEVSPFEWQGHRYVSDEAAQIKILRAVEKAKADSTYTETWKTLDGYVAMVAADFLALSAAYEEHVRGLFVREAQLAAQVQAAETAEAVAAVQW